MEKENVRLGGMALQNGVLVHGPTSWGAAVRGKDGVLHVASGKKPRFGESVDAPVLRGPLRLAEAFALLPVVHRALPQARFPFARPPVLGSIVASSVVARALRRSTLSAGGKELAAGAVSLLPAALALRGSGLAEYHGAEHVSIGTYENDGERAPKEHPRCGSQLIGPMLVSSLAANVAAARAPAAARGLARFLGTTAAIGASVEVFALDGAKSRAPDRACTGAAGLRAPAPFLDRRAVGRSGRGRGRCARRLSRSRAVGVAARARRSLSSPGASFSLAGARVAARRRLPVLRLRCRRATGGGRRAAALEPGRPAGRAPLCGHLGARVRARHPARGQSSRRILFRDNVIDPQQTRTLTANSAAARRARR